MATYHAGNPTRVWRSYVDQQMDAVGTVEATTEQASPGAGAGRSVSHNGR